MGRDEALHLPPQFTIIAAGPGDEAYALLFRDFDRATEDRIRVQLLAGHVVVPRTGSPHSSATFQRASAQKNKWSFENHLSPSSALSDKAANNQARAAV